MKRLLNVMRYAARPIAGLFLITLLFTACKKDDAPGYVNTPAAGLMAFNLAPDKSPVGFTLSGNNLGNAGLDYTGFTGAYLPIYVGSRELRSFDYNTGSTIAISNGEFKDSLYYSAFLLGANGVYRNVLVNDQLDSLAVVPGKAWVRYINAIPDSAANQTITIGTGTENPINENAPFASVSGFRAVAAGPVNTAVNNGTNISVNRTIDMEENKIYTVLFVGLPDQTDPARAVQIRFIQNGAVIP